MNKLLVSVIIPSHNRSLLLKRAIQSVLKQTYSELECIVIDDASIDDTDKVINSFNDERLRYYYNTENKGPSAARNIGIKRSEGDLIAFLDDDDEWMLTKLEKQVSLIHRLPKSFGLIYCWMDYIDNQGEVIHKHHPKLRGDVFSKVLDAQRIGGCPTLLVKKEVCEDVCGFDENLPRGNDGDFIRRICLRYKVDYIPEVLVKVYTGHGYPQIGMNNRIGIENHIKSQLVKLIKFEDELKYYPKERSKILFDLGKNYGYLGYFYNSFIYYLKGLKYFFLRKYFT